MLKRALASTSILSIIVVMLIIAAILLILHFVQNSGSSSDSFPFGIGIYTYEVLNKYSHIHDPSIGKQVNVGPNILQKNGNIHPFTQGLLFIDNEHLIESSGLYAISFLRKFELISGKTDIYYNVTSNYFAEGIALVIEPETYKKCIFVLTYKEKAMLVFDFDTLELYHTFEYELDGYGLTSNLDALHSIEDLKKGNFALYQRLWATSGDEYLYELEIPENFTNVKKLSIMSKVKITCAGFDIHHVNELEYHLHSKTIFANIFLTHLILELDITKGSCLKIINLSGLAEKCDNQVVHLPRATPFEEGRKSRDSILNGIAIDSRNNREMLPNLLVTGKLWPNMFEIKLVKSSEKLVASSVLSEYFKTIGNRL
ncbi:Glutamine cyclotransferase [Plasmodium ovale wallikeri]|uniref:Glutamine cyclotransferase n=1 Tax=Plasmodium ovale wallikeri TaxID=864142 RepID=A0A1A8ZIG1_PLAOA|nr:Glutamine cyclotransferase [Plasmodium ovale wallikeri]SBT43660.1 Glutamine cyclotransferase [Plasmodium ovale wallikeri]